MTTVLDAQPDAIMPIPEDSYWPLVLAFGMFVALVGLLINLLALIAVGGFISLLALGGWFWPQAPHGEENAV